MTKVFVTGGSGFIAKHILRELLEQGYEVKTSVRSEKRKGEIQAIFPKAKIEFAMLDLNKDEGWSEALKGCDVLLHTASPFPLTEPKNRDDLIRPAVEGTMRAMNAALEAGIKRVILTSSNAAIYKDPAKPKEAPSDESNWTDPDAKYVGAYEASKTLAERAAWSFVEDHPEISLTTINPGGVFGPPMDGNYGTSLEIIERLIAGKDPVLPPMNLPLVDVRDVAKMHVEAIKNESAKGERISATSETLDFIAVSGILREWDPECKVATKVAPSWLLKTFGLFNVDAKLAAMNIGRNLAVSGAKAERVLGISFIPAKDAIVASAQAVRNYQK